MYTLGNFLSIRIKLRSIALDIFEISHPLFPHFFCWARVKHQPLKLFSFPDSRTSLLLLFSKNFQFIVYQFMSMFVFMDVKHFFFFIYFQKKNKKQNFFSRFCLLAHWTYWLESSCTINCWPHIDNIGSTMPCLHFVWKLWTNNKHK
jgi:hypothetical protein